MEANKFDANAERDRMVRWVRKWFEENGPEAKAVIGLSGGKDSTIAAAILAEALGPDRVVGLILPDGDMPDKPDALRAASACGIRPVVIDISAAVSSFLGGMRKVLYDNVDGCNMEKKEVWSNVPPRARMTILYMVAQSLPGGGRVANTCNLSENYVGFATKGGDSVGDFALFDRLTATEVIAIGDAMCLPYDLVHKAPADGLTGRTDEDTFGFTYRDLDRYIRTGVCEYESVREKIDRAHRMTAHKRQPMPCYMPDSIMR